ncbi:uncharacterized protein H6S33_004646 [Morchella sextelata]|uniref:uncharacterized protein n=1 Tax=Morchella sextelata TaxID=1174677 RepID=UPI001D04A95D|nr:uncharacterized protein H6S33_004646 [Morchella sextelata]KAH0605424.1 hypothetical protein H6S33_004646 [Morchella sextelata]
MSSTLPTDPSELIKHFQELSKTLDDQYDTTHDLTDLHESLAALQSALSALPPDDTDDARRADLVGGLYKGLNRCYKHTGAIEYLDGATQYAKEAIELTQDTPTQVQHLANTAVFMSMKHVRTGLLADIEEAITYCEIALAVMSELEGEPDVEERASTCSKACVFFERKYKQTADIEDLQMAVHYGREAVEYSGRASALHRSGRVNNLAKHLWARYQLLGDIDDLRKAAVCWEEVTETMPQDGPDWSHLVANVVNFLREVYKESKDVGDFRRMVAFFRRRVEATPRLHPGRGEALVGLCRLLIDDYMQTGDLKAVGEAIKHAREVLELTPPGHPNRAGALTDLASYLAREYQDTGDLETLDNAIHYNEEAVALNDPTVNRVDHLSMISLSLGSRYERKGDLDDLRRSILYAKEGITVAHRWGDEEVRVPIFHNLARLQYMMFKRAATQENLEEMIICAEAAVEQTPPMEPRSYIPLSNLAGCLEAKYYYTRDRADLVRATEIMEELLEVALPGDTTRHKFMSNLAAFLTQKNLGEEKRDELEMKKALYYAEEALSVVPKDHTDRAGFLVNLGLIRTEVFDGADNDTVQLFIEAWECHHSAPLARINGARYAAGALVQVGRWEESSQMLEDAIRMLPKVSTRSLEGQDKQQMLLKISGLPATAACVALQAGKSAYHALGLLELSRGIIIGSTIDYRGDISDLKERHPEKFQKLEDLRTEIDTPLPDSYDSHTADSRSFQTEEAYLQARSRAFKRREEALQEMEEILKEIRKLPGCEGFQLAPSEEELKSWAKDGPVVTFVSSSYRSDAIILTSSSITALPLPDLNFDDIQDRLSVIFETPAKKSKKKKSPAAEMREYAERNQKMREMLLWLWNAAVKPVLQHLEIIDEHGNSKVDKPPHVWWIGTGRLNIAPFHAAGDHSRGSTENALSHVISSYTPTIKALSYARGKKLSIFSKPDPRLLLVSMTKTPGGGALPDVGKEVEGIMDITKGLVSKHLEHPSADDVLKQFGSFEVMHFACHGVSNAYDPSESHLMLQKDSNTADSLTVAAISRKNAKTAQIAYLSACSTANNAATQLADEIIHIASGFQLAGFNHVLATMWPAESAVCTEIAVAFYKALFDGKGSEEGHLKVSRALRDAVLEARGKNPLLPRKWAPFIHLGA